MIHSLPQRIIGTLFAILLMVMGLTVAPMAHAQPTNDFSQPYGLLVHNTNQNRPVSRIKTLEILLNYFPVDDEEKKDDLSISFTDAESTETLKTGCTLGLFDCGTDYFYPEEAISQKDFLEWFFRLKYAKQPVILKKLYRFPDNAYASLWVEARRLNLLSKTEITYQTLRDFLYRNKVVELNNGQAYREGLTIDDGEINVDNYHNPKEIDRIIADMESAVAENGKKENLTSGEEEYMRRVNEALESFRRLRGSLRENPYLLSQRSDLPPEIGQAVRLHGLQDVLFSYSYDYSKNAAYRQHNLVTGVSKMHGKVFLPGEVMDYWSIISDKNLSDFRYGWVISGGKEEWEFGGGICGSSSMVFLPSWRAGFEILERKSHSKYYSNLYPMEFIGLDATVYRPRPNLKMRNQTDSPILFNVINDKEKKVITIEIIGNPFYKNIDIEGPIFIKKNQVQWIRHLEDFEGNIVSETLESKYSAIY